MDATTECLEFLDDIRRALVAIADAIDRSQAHDDHGDDYDEGGEA